MPTPVETLLTSAGLPAEDATKLTTLTEEEIKTFDPKPYAEKIRNNYQTQFRNDPEFFANLTIETLPPDVKKKLEGGQFARAANIVRDRLLKGLGLTEADYQDFTEEQKKEIDLFVPAIAEKFVKTKASDKQVQQDLINARKELEKYGPEYEKGIETKYQTESEKKVTAAIFNANLIGELSTIPGLKIAAADIAKTANDILQNKYAFEKVGDYSVELRRKDNPAMKVFKGQTSQDLTLKDALLEIATERGWIEADKGDNKGSGITPIIPGKDGTLHMVAPHLRAKVAKKIAEEA